MISQPHQEVQQEAEEPRRVPAQIGDRVASCAISMNSGTILDLDRVGALVEVHDEGADTNGRSVITLAWDELELVSVGPPDPAPRAAPQSKGRTLPIDSQQLERLAREAGKPLDEISPELLALYIDAAIECFLSFEEPEERAQQLADYLRRKARERHASTEQQSGDAA